MTESHKLQLMQEITSLGFTITGVVPLVIEKGLTSAFDITKLLEVLDRSRDPQIKENLRANQAPISLSINDQGEFETPSQPADLESEDEEEHFYDCNDQVTLTDTIIDKDVDLPAAFEKLHTQHHKLHNSKEDHMDRTRGSTEGHMDRPRGSTESHMDRPRGSTESDMDRPRGSTESDMDRPRGSTESDMDRPRGSTESDMDRPRGSTESDMDRTRGSTESDMDRPRGSTESDMDRPRGSTESDMDRPRGSTESDMDRTRGSTEVHMDRPRVSTESHMDRPRGSTESHMDRPRGSTEGQRERSRGSTESHMDRTRGSTEGLMDEAKRTSEDHMDRTRGSTEGQRERSRGSTGDQTGTRLYPSLDGLSTGSTDIRQELSTGNVSGGNNREYIEIGHPRQVDMTIASTEGHMDRNRGSSEGLADRTKESTESHMDRNNGSTEDHMDRTRGSTEDHMDRTRGSTDSHLDKTRGFTEGHMDRNRGSTEGYTDRTREPTEGHSNRRHDDGLSKNHYNDRHPHHTQTVTEYAGVHRKDNLRAGISLPRNSAEKPSEWFVLSDSGSEDGQDTDSAVDSEDPHHTQTVTEYAGVHRKDNLRAGISLPRNSVEKPSEWFVLSDSGSEDGQDTDSAVDSEDPHHTQTVTEYAAVHRKDTLRTGNSAEKPSGWYVLCDSGSEDGQDPDSAMDSEDPHHAQTVTEHSAVHRKDTLRTGNCAEKPSGWYVLCDSDSEDGQDTDSAVDSDDPESTSEHSRDDPRARGGLRTSHDVEMRYLTERNPRGPRDSGGECASFGYMSRSSAHANQFKEEKKRSGGLTESGLYPDTKSSRSDGTESFSGKTRSLPHTEEYRSIKIPVSIDPQIDSILLAHIFLCPKKMKCLTVKLYDHLNKGMILVEGEASEVYEIKKRFEEILASQTPSNENRDEQERHSFSSTVSSRGTVNKQRSDERRTTYSDNFRNPSHIGRSDSEERERRRTGSSVDRQHLQSGVLITEHSMIKVRVKNADITTLKVDAIVNAANERLKHGGGVARAIADKAGQELQRECQNFITKGERKLNVTGTFVSTGGKLPAKHVIHAVGPKWSYYGDVKREECARDLRRTIFNCLLEANKLGCRSIAIPSISAGKLQYYLKHPCYRLKRKVL